MDNTDVIVDTAGPIRKVARRLHPLSTLWLTLMWCMLYGEITVANIVGGLILSVVIHLAFPLPAMPVGFRAVNVGGLALLAWKFVSGLITGALHVTAIAWRPTPPPTSALIQVPLHVESNFVLFLGVCLYNLQPGGTITDIDLKTRMLTIHLLDGSTPEKIDAQISAVGELEKQLNAAFVPQGGDR